MQLIHQGKEHDMSEKKTKHDNYNDAYERRRIPIGLYAAGEDGEDSDIAQIFIDRHETIKIMDNIGTASSYERSMGTETLYEYDTDVVECEKCRRKIHVSGFVSIYPPGTVGIQELNVEPREEDL